MPSKGVSSERVLGQQYLPNASVAFKEYPQVSSYMYIQIHIHLFSLSCEDQCLPPVYPSRHAVAAVPGYINCKGYIGKQQVYYCFLAFK